MLKSTYKLLSSRKKNFEEVICRYKKASKSPKSDRKIEQAHEAARKIAGPLRRFRLIETFDFTTDFVCFGADVFLKNIYTGEERLVTILGDPDVTFNPRYYKGKRFIGYSSDESVQLIGGKVGYIVDSWKIERIEKFIDKSKKELQQ